MCIVSPYDQKKTKSHFSGGSFVCLLKSWSATTILLTLFFIFFWRHPFPSPFLSFIFTYGNINDKSATTVHFSMNMRGNVLKNWEKTAEISIKSLNQKKAHKNEAKKVYRYDSFAFFFSLTFTYYYYMHISIVTALLSKLLLHVIVLCPWTWMKK